MNKVSLRCFVADMYLSSNSLTALPTEIGNLARLVSLSLDYNYLTFLPTEMENMISLAENEYSSVAGNFIDCNEYTFLPTNFCFNSARLYK